MLGNNKLFDILENDNSLDEDFKNFIKEIFDFSCDEPGHYKEKFKELIEKYANLSTGGK